MRLLILSDLHRELWRDDAPPIRDTPRPDVVILAGDIDHPERAMHWAARRFAGLPVLYVCGNHEGYGATWEGALRTAVAQEDAASGVRLLDRGEWVISDERGDVRFLGATLWTDFALFGEAQREAAMAAAEPVMLDYRRIQLEAGGLHALTPADTVRLHQRDRAWLAEKLDTPFAGRTVVVTHMAPSMRSVAARYAQDLVSAGFASNLDTLAGRADLWIHGHMHDSFDYRLGRCRVVCNPCGYRRRDGTPENAHFDPGLVVEI